MEYNYAPIFCSPASDPLRQADQPGSFEDEPSGRRAAGDCAAAARVRAMMALRVLSLIGSVS